jgi:uncharacterized protein YndB with AHSA1/START domain
MTDRSVTHSTWTLERTYDARPARVFAAFADKEAKAQWFGGGDELQWDLDFRVGGREVNIGRAGSGMVFALEAVYQDIVPDERIVYSYDMKMNDERISVSLATIQLEPVDGGTRLTYTEQGAYLDGLDTPEAREHGTGELLDALGNSLQGAATNA